MGMLQAMSHLDELSAKLDDHQLYRWITSSRHEDPRRHLDWAVSGLLFIMAFPYYNERYLRYARALEAEDETPDEAAVNSGLRRVINAQAQEDRTHSRLFLRDIKAMHLDEVWSINRPSTALWSLFSSPMMSPFREVLSRRIRSVVNVDNSWPPFRYLNMEELEHFGNQVFQASASKAREIEKRYGIKSIYFGDYHLERESGHVGGNEFAKVDLTAEQEEHARGIIDFQHNATSQMADLFYEFASAVENAESAGAVLEREQNESLAHVAERVAEHQAGKVPRPAWKNAIAGITPVSPEQAARGLRDQSGLAAAWQEHHQTFLDHPYQSLFREAKGPEAAFALRCVSLLFGARICALHDFYKFDCRMEGVTGPEADIIGFLGRTLSTQGHVFFHDWAVLDMDKRVPWQLPEMLEWIFLDPVYGRAEMEALHEFRREVLRINNSPVIKYWAIISVNFIARALFQAAKPLTDIFAKENPSLPPLVYFGSNRHLLYQDVEPNWIDPGHPTSLAHVPVTEQEHDYILKMMEVFDRYGQRQFDRLVRAMTTDRERFGFLY